jgi:hypothetical protein
MNDIQLARHYPKNFYQLRKRITEISGQEIFDPARPKIPVIFRPSPAQNSGDFSARTDSHEGLSVQAENSLARNSVLPRKTYIY